MQLLFCFNTHANLRHFLIWSYSFFGNALLLAAFFYANALFLMGISLLLRMFDLRPLYKERSYGLKQWLGVNA
jgi:hypothetical protein